MILSTKPTAEGDLIFEKEQPDSPSWHLPAVHSQMVQELQFVQKTMKEQKNSIVKKQKWQKANSLEDAFDKFLTVYSTSSARRPTLVLYDAANSEMD